jgi:two-component system, OmpR family, sensor kinase
MVLQRPSLRTKLMAIALVGAVIMALLGGGLIFTARQAKSEVDASGQSYRLVSAYTRLVYQASLLEEQAWTEINHPHRMENGPSPVVLTARGRFNTLLDETTRLAADAGPERLAANREIREQAASVLATYDDFGGIADKLQTLTREQGIHAATAYADVAFRPFGDFERLVKAEVDSGDALISGNTERAAKLTRVVMAAATISFGLGLLLTFFQSKLIFGRLSRGLKRLEQGVRAFGQGDLTRRIRLDGQDELSRLADVFNAMAAELSDKQRALEQAKTGLEAAVAERTRKLEAANAALAEEDGRRRRFLAEAGHELRTPLTIIRGEAQVALRASEPRAESAAAFGRILEQTQGMGRLVDDLFLIARAEAGGLSLLRQPLDLNEIAVRAASDFEALASEQGAQVTAVPGAAVWVDADPDRLRQAIAALMDNALRHGGQGVKIELRAILEGQDAVLIVDDDGPGVPAADIGELFARFRRGETRGDGSGLGLSVVRALAEAHGGSATLAARPGGGARATLRLPALQLVREAAE